MTGPLKKAQELAQALERHRPHLSRDVVPGAAALHRVALQNAHGALADVREDRADRAALAEAGKSAVMPLSMRETIELLQRQRIGRLAYVARADVPDVVPVNYTWYDGGVLIRSGPGSKLQAAKRGDTVALEVDEVDLEHRTGCSAVVVGKAEVVDARDVPTDVEPWAAGPHQYLIRVQPSRITGRRLG